MWPGSRAFLYAAFPMKLPGVYWQGLVGRTGWKFSSLLKHMHSPTVRHLSQSFKHCSRSRDNTTGGYVFSVSHSGKHIKRNNKRASRNPKSPLTHFRAPSATYTTLKPIEKRLPPTFSGLLAYLVA